MTTPASILKEHAFEAETLEKEFMLKIAKDKQVMQHFAALMSFIFVLVKRNQLNLTSDSKTLDAIRVIMAQFIVPLIELINKENEEKN